MAENNNNNKGKIVCVTGAGGFVGSWLVKVLLSYDYTVHGRPIFTYFLPVDDKNAHLKILKKEYKNLKLFKADLLDYESLCAAIRGCDGVFHNASPVPSSSVSNPEVEVIEPAVDGTLNVLKACCEVNVKKVVCVSSIGAIMVIPNRPTDQPLDETFWSDQEFCKSNNEWYCLSKTQAESQAWEFSERNDIDFVSICPSIVIGPMLQNTINHSSMILIKLINGEKGNEVEDRPMLTVDVRDLAEALVLVYENPEANGRYICSSHEDRTKDLVEILKKHYPDYKYPNKFIEPKGIFTVTSAKLQKLGWSYRPLEETLVDSVKNYAQNGLLG